MAETTHDGRHESDEDLAERYKYLSPEQVLILTRCIHDGAPTLPVVRAFSDRMEAKLDQNRHKGDRKGWVLESPHELLVCLLKECSELARALDKGTSQDVMNEAVDVANFAMMVADSFDPVILTEAVCRTNTV